MATTINNYSVGLTLDARDYIDSSKLSRSETRMLMQDINKARDPAEDYSRAIDRLSRAYREGAIEIGTYNRLVDAQKQKLESATASTDKKSSSLERMSQYANIASGAINTIRASIDTVAAVKAVFDQVSDRIGQTADAARTLGLSFNELTSLRFAGKMAGASIESIETAIKQMMKRGFATEDIRESFLKVADEISGMATQTERMQKAYEVFGKQGADVLLMLQEGRAAIEENVAFAEKWASISIEQSIAVEEYGDTMDKIMLLVEGVTNKFVAELAPVLTLIGEEFLAHASSVEDIDGLMRSMVDSSVYIFGTFADLNQIMRAVERSFFSIANRDFSQLGKDLGQVFELGRAERYLQEVYDKRLELDRKAAARRKELDEQRKNQQIKDTEEAGKAEEAKIENFDSLYRQAIANATKEFERRAQEVKRMADSIARGPASMEVGSAEAAKFFADTFNRRLADQIKAPEVQVNAAGVAQLIDGKIDQAATRGEQALIDEAAKQLEAILNTNQKQTETVEAIKRLIEVTSQNGFRRL